MQFKLLDSAFASQSLLFVKHQARPPETKEHDIIIISNGLLKELAKHGRQMVY